MLSIQGKRSEAFSADQNFAASEKKLTSTTTATRWTKKNDFSQHPKSHVQKIMTNNSNSNNNSTTPFSSSKRSPSVSVNSKYHPIEYDTAGNGLAARLATIIKEPQQSTSSPFSPSSSSSSSSSPVPAAASSSSNYSTPFQGSFTPTISNPFVSSSSSSPSSHPSPFSSSSSSQAATSLLPKRRAATPTTETTSSSLAATTTMEAKTGERRKSLRRTSLSSTTSSGANNNNSPMSVGAHLRPTSITEGVGEFLYGKHFHSRASNKEAGGILRPGQVAQLTSSWIDATEAGRQTDTRAIMNVLQQKQLHEEEMRKRRQEQLQREEDEQLGIKAGNGSEEEESLEKKERELKLSMERKRRRELMLLSSFSTSPSVSPIRERILEKEEMQSVLRSNIISSLGAKTSTTITTTKKNLQELPLLRKEVTFLQKRKRELETLKNKKIVNQRGKTKLALLLTTRRKTEDDDDDDESKGHDELFS